MLLNRLKTYALTLLFPHAAIAVLLVPVSLIFLVCSVLFLGAKTPVTILSYVVAAYTLTVWCCRIPRIVRLLKDFQKGNKYALLWRSDAHLRVLVSLYGSLTMNLAYALMQLGLGIYHASFWFSSLACYYFLLALMRFFLLRHTRLHEAGVLMRDELRRYRACGWILLSMNLVLSLMVFFMIYWGRTFHHHEITAIAMAAYTFASFTVAIVNIVRYRKYESPVYSASKAISLASAAVSMLTLETTLMTAFGAEGEKAMTPQQQKIMLGATGAVISLLIISMAIGMIVTANRKLKKIEEETSIYYGKATE